MEEKIRLIEKSQKEIEKYNYYLNSEIPIEEIQNIKKYILGNEQLMKIYKENDPIVLTAKYLKKIKELRKLLNSTMDYQYIANVLEYFRFTCMRENISGVIPGMAYLENLSDSKFSSVLLGKASSEGQVAAIVDVLSNKLDVTMDNVGYIQKENQSENVSNYACLMIKDETGTHYIDAYNYNGKMDAKQKLISRNCFNNIYPLVFDNRTIVKAKRKVAKHLINKLNIMEIINSLELNGLTQKEINEKFIEYINSHKDNYDDIEINASTITVNNEMLEISRLLELLYLAVGIRYRVIDDKKENSTFEVILDEESTIVSLDKESNKKLIK